MWCQLCNVSDGTRWARYSPSPLSGMQLTPLAHMHALQAYLKLVLAAAQCVQKSMGSTAHARVALKCLTGLLRAVPHFNYTSDILQASTCYVLHASFTSNASGNGKEERTGQNLCTGQ